MALFDTGVFQILSVDRSIKPSVTPSSIVFYFILISNMKSIVHPLPPLFFAQYATGILPPAPVRGPGITYFINLDGERDIGVL